MIGDMVCASVAGTTRLHARSAGHPWPAGDPLTHTASNPEALGSAERTCRGMAKESPATQASDARSVAIPIASSTRWD